MKIKAFFLAVLSCSLLFAQTNETGSISGIVIDSNGLPLKGVTVKCTQPDGSYPQAAFTNDIGMYRILFLQPGEWELTFTAENKPTKKVTGVFVSATQTEIVDMLLESSNVNQTLTVTAARELIQRATTETNFQLDIEEIKALPVSRTANDLLAFVPGADTRGVFGGSGDQANSYTLDGVSVTSTGFGGSFLLPNVNWIKEFQVKGLGAGAEYGNFQGGLVNIVTKSGSNTFSGDVHAIFESESWNSSNLVPGQTGSETDTFQEFNADVSGALVRDKLYYFFSIEQQRRDINVVNLLAPNSDTEINFYDTQIESQETKLYSKLTWQVGQFDTVNFVLSLDDLETDNRGFSNLTTPNAAFNQTSPALIYNLSWNHIFGNSNFLELKFTGYDAEDDRDPINGDRPAAIEIGGSGFRGFNSTFRVNRELKNNSVRGVYNAFFNVGSSTHTLKIGAESIVGSFLNESTRNGGFTWRPLLEDFQTGEAFTNRVEDLNTWVALLSEWGGDTRLDAETTTTALFIQDEVKLGDRLDISVGLRFNSWDGEITPGFNGGGAFETLSDSAVAPRFGLTYDLSGDNTLVARAHYGRYYQGMFASQYQRTAGANLNRDNVIEFFQWIGTQLPDLNTVITLENRDQFFTPFGTRDNTPTTGRIENYEQAYTDQLVIALEKQFLERWKVGFNYIDRENKNILVLADKNINSNYVRYDNVTVSQVTRDQNDQEVSRTTVTQLPSLFVPVAEGFNQDLVLTSDNNAFREVEQIHLTLDGSGDGWSMQASIVNSDIVGNFYSVSGEEEVQGISVDPFVNPNEAINGTGNLPGYSEWEYKLRFIAELPWNFRVSGFYRMRSGEYHAQVYTVNPANTFTADGVDLDASLIGGLTGQPILLEQRGSQQLDNVSTLDFRLEYLVDLGGGRLSLAADAFNLFNEDEITLLNDNLTGDSFSRQAPRSIQFKATYSW
ncbi:TonB-dependent receptor [Acanthopleuribacter pedis]|uniref:TonB-dependent receptor n=1 Tax=Acanthopleuribacter pedis TaxID=442870 RepID=A0A8J7QA73_9BACT|nr:TonB-dependent receptor [Acanthopleuribacter pedis]MBO1322792.1 TonB-dependent receptor [Acanthopleuribacter pedis]